MLYFLDFDQYFFVTPLCFFLRHTRVDRVQLELARYRTGVVSVFWIGINLVLYPVSITEGVTERNEALSEGYCWKEINLFGLNTLYQFVRKVIIEVQLLKVPFI